MAGTRHAEADRDPVPLTPIRPIDVDAADELLLPLTSLFGREREVAAARELVLLGRGIICDTRCVDPLTDRRHCGACGNAYPSGVLCVGGLCQSASCPAGQTLCNGACGDVLSDVAHCGGRGNTCDLFCETCGTGACQPVWGRSDCAGARGGSCPACPTVPSDFFCQQDADCLSGICQENGIRGFAPTCTDGVQNGSETEIDCGGPACPQCDGGFCVVDGDCRSGFCDNSFRGSSCTDGVVNVLETDVDCCEEEGVEFCSHSGSCVPCAISPLSCAGINQQ